MEEVEIVGETQEKGYKGNKNKSFKFKYLTSEDKQEIYILGPTFVKNNKDKCSLIIDDTINSELRDKYKFNKKGEHSVTLIINEENVNFSFLFYICKNSSEESFLESYRVVNNISGKANIFYKENYKIENLIDVSSLENLDTSEYTDLSYIFCGCSEIKDFNFVKKWDVSKCKNFESMFFDCRFNNLDFLSNWNLINAINLEDMFRNCINLNDINGIKNWNVENAENFHGMFYFCLNLIDANALQNWNMNKAKDIRWMFAFCKNLLYVDSLYKWKLNENVNKSNIIKGSNEILNIPSIFKNTSSSSCVIY